MLKRIIIASIAAVAASTAVYAENNEGCTKAPKEQWLTIDQIKSKLTGKGFTVKKVEFDDGCAEAKVTDKDGKSREVYLDPATAEEVKHDD